MEERRLSDIFAIRAPFCLILTTCSRILNTKKGNISFYKRILMVE